MTDISVDLHLYGTLARYGAEEADIGSANVMIRLKQGDTIGDLLAHLGMPTEERGITFVNGNLSAMPGLQPDLDHVLADGDRVAFFDLRSMWPFQYRHGAAMTDEMSRALASGEDSGLHHSYEGEPRKSDGM